MTSILIMELFKQKRDWNLISLRASTNKETNFASRWQRAPILLNFDSKWRQLNFQTILLTGNAAEIKVSCALETGTELSALLQNNCTIEPSVGIFVT